MKRLKKNIFYLVQNSTVFIFIKKSETSKNLNKNINENYKILNVYIGFNKISFFTLEYLFKNNER